MELKICLPEGDYIITAVTDSSNTAETIAVTYEDHLIDSTEAQYYIIDSGESFADLNQLLAVRSRAFIPNERSLVSVRP
ncbi:hypothetical protein CANARDRAFT_10519 [[Candida] arabinofermentans NRRL YB-2248]|uniref:Uncharacterized protein n=1 Tax=[Candida] arabinofermentans NRRL YB-2248 TaxID=983967 RepID=A0A1E4SSJ5_9ASCO|nr:hypothetical protein CANARDRAFT_10519 [[Candida] arabinofermentans NRRL YB-2248]